MVYDSSSESSESSGGLREMLRIFVSKNNLKFTVLIERPQDPFQIGHFQSVSALESNDPSLSVFQFFILASAQIYTKVKDEGFYKGIAQNAVQLDSALSNRKRKANEMEEGAFAGKVFGIITDAKRMVLPCMTVRTWEVWLKWFLVRHIAWLLDEVQKSDSDSRRR
ncbi:hypothetical protein RhiirA1_524076 [Rhizophagus irregularis]|uniref:Uncharacterized protein n=1 Tax=Rhizophagus irregularis TaxID=588596 RepID=A0A2N0RA98_9GLOM|nr:hypothetical protein RhiirA1_490934 [Rhizophagus irregularis]PKC61594.1 hypothetical protein RhiirA1_524076 [Rhizophagus irregularis]